MHKKSFWRYLQACFTDVLVAVILDGSKCKDYIVSVLKENHCPLSHWPFPARRPSGTLRQQSEQCNRLVYASTYCTIILPFNLVVSRTLNNRSPKLAGLSREGNAISLINHNLLSFFDNCNGRFSLDRPPVVLLLILTYISENQEKLLIPLQLTATGLITINNVDLAKRLSFVCHTVLFFQEAVFQANVISRLRVEPPRWYVHVLII